MPTLHGAQRKATLVAGRSPRFIYFIYLFPFLSFSLRRSFYGVDLEAARALCHLSPRPPILSERSTDGVGRGVGSVPASFRATHVQFASGRRSAPFSCRSVYYPARDPSFSISERWGYLAPSGGWQGPQVGVYSPSVVLRHRHEAARALCHLCPRSPFLQGKGWGRLRRQVRPRVRRSRPYQVFEGRRSVPFPCVSVHRGPLSFQRSHRSPRDICVWWPGVVKVCPLFVPASHFRGPGQGLSSSSPSLWVGKVAP